MDKLELAESLPATADVLRLVGPLLLPTGYLNPSYVLPRSTPPLEQKYRTEVH